MLTSRRGFLKRLAALAAACTLGTVPALKRAAEPDTVYLDFYQLEGPRGAGWAAGVVRFNVNGGPWQQKEFKITRDQPIVWLTPEIGLGFAHTLEG